MTGELQIDYDALAQDAQREAMLSIVRTVLKRVAGWGHLPGEHHFYIAFDTRAPGVVVSKRLKQKYPQEMTIVLQHQFRNLSVDDNRFEVTLSFDNVPERLTVPLRAIRVFFDPSVPYGLQFESSDLVAKTADQLDVPVLDAVLGEPPLEPTRQPAPDVLAEPAAPARARSPRKPRNTPKDSTRDGSVGDASAPLAADIAEPVGAALPRAQAGGRSMPAPSKPDEPANDSKVVQLDKFRKR
ncbi:MAG TPA: ClpXP protease specificity-enhancing factor SspB [Hyphomicrobiaceae bacterium]|nr:ClpXP protease specificity-enhancing factor SspB [Hyphomicrobiaceae bacterium]